MPVCVGGQQGVRGERLALRLVDEHCLAVAAGAGPIHQTFGLEGGRVQHLHVRVDHLRRCSRQRLIFICADRAVEGENDAQARMPGVVFAGGINQIIAAEALDGLAEGLCGPCWRVVDVQGDHAPTCAAAAFTAALSQGRGHKAAVVFEHVLLGLRHGHVFCVGLGAHGGVSPGLLDELWPGPVHLLPYFIGSACADAQLHVVFLL